MLSESGAASRGALEAQVSLVLFSFDFLEPSGSSLLKNDSWVGFVFVFLVCIFFESTLEVRVQEFGVFEGE